MYKKKRYGALLIILTVAVAALMILNVIFSSGLNASASAEKTLTSSGRYWKIDSVEGLEELRQSLFSSAVAENNFARASFDGDRWVIVKLKGDSLYEQFERSAYSDFSEYCRTDAADKQTNLLTDKQNEFLAALDENSVEYTYKYSYTTLTNGVAVKVNSKGYNVISGMPEVEDVYFSDTYSVPKVAVSNNANVYKTGIYDSSSVEYNGKNYKGEGMVVAILDTGLDYSHEAFAAMPQNPLWDKDYVADRIATHTLYAKANADEVYYNSKIPYAYDYADDDFDVYPSYSTHGTHVAGIVAGKSDYLVNEKESDETFIGVAPEAQLVICKVFTDNLDSDYIGGANSMDILRAVSDCVALGVDVINMSLGTSCGFTDKKSDEFTNTIYANVKKAGISLVVAASNDYSSGFGGGNGTNLASNPDSGTVGAPSTYDAALSVASINGQLASYIEEINDNDHQVAFITNSSDANGNELKFTELMYEKLGKAPGEDLTLKYVVIGGVGRPTNYNNTIKKELQNKGNADGVVALIKRGDTTFAEKVQAAMNNGMPDACIIYNNVSGTIRMSLGDVENPVPTCSINMDAGKIFVEKAKKNVGYLKISNSYKAGPFMSEFSSWGPTPNLQLKPEITAHGGEITSAVPGGYDIYSGTSMAAPNMSGAIALLRQHIKEINPGLSSTELTARVNQVLMSTATIALNEEHNPYSPRKQGAGLAGIADAVHTEGYITVLDANGNDRDKTKIELYDDKERTGKYELEFIVNNISGKTETYNPITYVMTETLASDNKTVAEKAHVFDDSAIVYYVDGEENEGTITVPANARLKVKVVITLGSAARKYLDDSFDNGMYVEGFVSLKATGNTKVTLGLPYLGFYGDWTDAPLFDYDTYEIAESKMDTSVPEEEKLKASAAMTRPLGMYFDDKYVIELGSYLYDMEESEVAIYPTKEKAAISMFDREGTRTLYEFYMIYAGLLRGARYLDVEITDSVTGDVVFSQRKANVGKSYAAGGSNVGGMVRLEIKPQEWGLLNNSTYIVKLKGELDYDGGEEPERNTFDCQFTVDYEEPDLVDYRIRYESYKDENKQIQYRIYIDADVYDNQYVMDVMPCYTKQSKKPLKSDPSKYGNELVLLTNHPIPVYGGKGEVTTVSFEITDMFDDFAKPGELYIVVEDYAMNQAMFVVDVSRATLFPEGVTISTDNKLTDTEVVRVNSDGKSKYNVYELKLAPNEVYRPAINVISEEGASERSLCYYIKSGSSYVRVNENEIFAAALGRAEIYLTDSEDGSGTIFAEIDVTVGGEKVALPRLNKISFLPVLNGQRYLVSLEGTSPVLELNPNQVDPDWSFDPDNPDAPISYGVVLRVEADPWYISDTLEYTWTSTDPEIASVDQNGRVKTYRKGSAIITVTVKGTTIKKIVNVKVGDDYRIVNYTLYDYYGGEICEIPNEKNVLYIDEDCFKYNRTLKELILPSTLTALPEEAFIGCVNLEKVYIPGQCTVLNKKAFAGCTSLKTVIFGTFVDANKVPHPDYPGAVTIGEEVFLNCTGLTTIENSKRITSAYNGAFEGCTSLEEIDISELRVAGKRVFARCSSLKTVITDQNGKTAIGNEMFYRCSSLTSFDYYNSVVPEMAFASTGLFRFDFHGDVTEIGNSAFRDAKFAEFTLPAGEYKLGGEVFSDNKLLVRIILDDGAKVSFSDTTAFERCTSFTEYRVGAGSANYSTENGVLYNKDKTVVCAVPIGKTEYISLGTETAIAPSAFAGNRNIKGLDFSGITSVGEYAFSRSGITEIEFSSAMSLTEIPEGVFSGCISLSSVVGLDNVVGVGKNAFYGCVSLTSIELPEAKEICEGAFSSSGISSLTASKTEKVGKEAFYATRLTEVNMPALSEIGESAFSAMPALKTVSVGAVTYMGDNAFLKSVGIDSVTFGEGTTRIGDYAFYPVSSDGTPTSKTVTALKTVVIPGTVTEIGEGAFAMATSLTAVTGDLSAVESIGNMAFYGCVELTELNLKSVISIGEYAFYASGLKKAELDSAKVIGELAFAASDLEEVTFGALERLGASAFIQTKLTSVTLPASFDTAYFDMPWNRYDEKNNLDEVRYRKVTTFGGSAFAYNDDLTEIKVEGEGEFFSVDGVLYSVSENGYILVQYPAGRRGGSYTVIDNTVMIGNGAFEGVENLDEIIFPYTVKIIGSYAFYGSMVSRYVFNSVKAPVLLADYVDGSVYASERDNSYLYYLYFIFGSGKFVVSSQVQYNCLESTIYYANFADYYAFVYYFGDEFKMGLTMVIPKNGIGYDIPLWTEYFDNIIVTDDILPDDTTHAALDAVNALDGIMTTEEIAAATSMEELKAISEAVMKARLAYNQIKNAEQLGLEASTEALVKLLAAEKALRDKKAALGSPVGVSKLVLSSIPTKIKYTEGESFDTAGMEIKIIFEDYSEIPLTSYTVDKTVLTLEDEFVTVSYVHDDGTVYTLRVNVNVVQRTSNGDEPASSDGDKGGLSVGAIVGISVGCGAAGLAIIALVVILVLRKRKNLSGDSVEKVEVSEEALACIDAAAEEAPCENEATEAAEVTAESAEEFEEAVEADENGDISAEPSENEENGEAE